jgi:hypothetical protein
MGRNAHPTDSAVMQLRFKLIAKTGKRIAFWPNNWLKKLEKHAFYPASPMSVITLIVGAALALSIVSVLLLIWFSEEGHEDDKGFHSSEDRELSDAQVNDGSKVELPNVAAPTVTAPIEMKR